MKQRKTKVLFIVSAFYQAGAERYTYELDRAIDKSEFEIEILSIANLNSSNRFIDFYYSKHLELGTKIHFFDQLKKSQTQTIIERVLNKVKLVKLKSSSGISFSFENYDAISIIGEYVYRHVAEFIPESCQKKLLIHPMKTRFQKDDTYAAFPKNRNFHFVSGFNELQIKWELNEFKNYSYTSYDLCFKIENYLWKKQYKVSEKPKIAIFTRLTHTKPLDPFIYVFQLVKNRIPDAELHIFGSGDPDKEGVSRYINQLNLNGSVFFRGHQNEMIKTSVEEDIDLVWLHGYYGLPGGFAGFEIALAKIPQLFWNFTTAQHTTFYDQFPMYTNTEEMANKTTQLLKDSAAASSLALAQYNLVREKYDIEKNISIMESLYENIRKDSSPS
jgi:glycosyltransferase involved in cell wall biosynthesis